MQKNSSYDDITRENINSNSNWYVLKKDEN